MGINLFGLTPIHLSKPKFAPVPGYGYFGRPAPINADEPKPMPSCCAFYGAPFRLPLNFPELFSRTECRSVLFSFFLADVAFFEPTFSGISVSGFPLFWLRSLVIEVETLFTPA